MQLCAFAINNSFFQNKNCIGQKCQMEKWLCMLWPFHNVHNKLNSFNSAFTRLLTWFYINQHQQPTLKAGRQSVRANLQLCPINVTPLWILPLFPGHPQPLGSRIYQQKSRYFYLHVYYRLPRFLKEIKCRQLWQTSRTWMLNIRSKTSVVCKTHIITWRSCYNKAIWLINQHGCVWFNANSTLHSSGTEICWHTSDDTHFVNKRTPFKVKYMYMMHFMLKNINLAECSFAIFKLINPLSWKCNW